MKMFLKRLLAVILTLTFLPLTAGCDGQKDNTSVSSNTQLAWSDFAYNSSSVSSGPKNQKDENTEQNSNFTLQGVWFSCFEMPFMWYDKDTAIQKIDNTMKSLANSGYNAVFCHVRPYADALYPSKFFPYSKYASGTQGKSPGYDPLQVMITAAKKYNLQFHAWVNPYRVTKAGEGEEAIAAGSIAKTWLTDGSKRAVKTDAGVYFNPSSSDVQKLVLNGIKEILNNYKVDGIHFDDYFYPTTNETFDQRFYNKYKSGTKSPLKLDDWRRANVSALVSSVYKVCKKRGVTFGISPAGDISLDKTDRNYKTLYADIPLWLNNKGYVDYIIPQIYFGYNHPIKKAQYLNLLNIWTALPRRSDVKLYVGLGAYKMDGGYDDSAEWRSDSTILARQVTDAYNKGMSGAVVFSCTAALNQNSYYKKQMNNMFKAIKNIRSK